MGGIKTLGSLCSWLGGVIDKLAAIATGTGPGPLLSPRGTRATSDWFRNAFAEDIRKNFEGSHDPQGVAWKPLVYRVGKPLILSGLMMATAIAKAKEAQWTGSAILIPRMTAPPYWASHQYGTGRIPKREFWGISPKLMAELGRRAADDYAEFLLEGGRN